jgi:hypothetical protein
MFGTEGSDTDRPGIEEQYASAVGSSNLRVGNDSNIRTPGDMIAAAGMNKHRTGLALRRLLTEWDAAQHPVPMPAEAVKALAETLPVEPPTLRTMEPNPHAGLVRVERRGKVEYCKPMEAAQREADAWHSHEVGILLQSLKSLPSVRAALVYEAESHGLAEPGTGIHLASAVLHWWLDPICPACSGRKRMLVEGTGRIGAKACKECRVLKSDPEGTGLRKVPHGWRGQKLVDHIGLCLKTAAGDLWQGARSIERSADNRKSRDDEQKRLDARKLIC